MANDAITERPLLYRCGDAELSGILTKDDSQLGLRPGVVIVHDAWGLGDLVKLRGRMLAELGYTALAIDMYGGRRKPKTMDEAKVQLDVFKADPKLLRARAMAGLEALARQPDVDNSRLAAIGYCFGGMTVVEMARAGAKCAAMVSFHGILTTSMPAQAGALNTRLLVCTGADDPLVPASDVDAFVQEMRAAKADCQTIIYSGAKHSFANPFASNNPGMGHDPLSDKRSWMAMQAHFAEAFASVAA
jgi:dienelactone hydrolase